MSNDVASSVKAFVVDRFLYGQGGDGLKSGDSFLQRNLMDSTGVLELVAWLEESYKIQVADQELVPDNLDSIDKIAAFVKKKQG